MTHLKKFFLHIFAALSLMAAALPAQAANKKTEPKAAAKKEAPKAKKDSAPAKKQPAAKKETPAKESAKGKKDAAKGKKENAPVGKKQQSDKSADKKTAAKDKKDHAKDKNGKNKKDTAKDKKEAAKNKKDNAKNAKDTAKGKTGKDKTTAKHEPAKTAQKPAPQQKEPTRPRADTRAHRPETQFPMPGRAETPQPKADYDEDAMQALVKRQNDKEKQAQAKPFPAPKTAEERHGGGTPIGRREADELIGSAMGLLGVSYRFGGTSASTGFDCSGFMQHIFRKTMQVSLPRTAAAQAGMGSPVSRSELQPGDMVFFRTQRGRISHVGLYIGGNRFIHAPRTGKSIEITSLSNKYWNSRYALARRVKRYDSGRFTN